MTSIRTTTLASATALLAGCAVTALPALGADEAKPAVGCAGLAFTDKTGDQVFSVPVVGSSGAGNANTDVTNGWFTNTEDGVFANIQIANLSKAVDSPSNGTTWYMVWDLAGSTKFVSASSDGSAVTYAYGTQDAGFTEEGSSTGRFIEGKDGVISIKVPAAYGGADGKKLGGPYAHVANAFQVPGAVGLLGTADDAPDSQKGNDYVVGSCSDGATGDTTSPPLTTGTTTTPKPSSAGTITFKGSVSAKKAKKAKGFSLTLSSTTPVTGVKVSLANAKKKVVASGTLAKLKGTATVKVKLKGKLTPGSYTLSITAKGAKKATFRLKVAR